MEKTFAIWLPSVEIQRSASGTSFTRLLFWRAPTERLMDAVAVVIDTERFQLVPQIKRIPQNHAIEILAAHGADQPFDERVRRGNMGKRLDFVDFKYTQICEPAMKTKQRIIIGASVFRQWLTGDGVIEHPANGYAVYVTTLDTEDNDGTGEYIHHHHHPMTA